MEGTGRNILSWSLCRDLKIDEWRVCGNHCYWLTWTFFKPSHMRQALFVNFYSFLHDQPFLERTWMNLSFGRSLLCVLFNILSIDLGARTYILCLWVVSFPISVPVNCICFSCFLIHMDVTKTGELILRCQTQIPLMKYVMLVSFCSPDKFGSFGKR